MPDAWEREHGLDPEDNGVSDPSVEGERGDLDRDGLTNRSEYLIGTDPNSSDSDGDGLSDFDEFTFYGTSPLVSNELTSDIAGTVDLGEHTASANWTYEDGGWVADNFRGEIAWDFTVPSDGWWVVELSAQLQGKLRSEESFPLRFAINDSELPLQTMFFRKDQPGTNKILTPYLTAGTHRLSVMLDNYVGRRTMKLLALRVLRHGGLDANENGIADWVEQEARAGNQLFAHSGESYVSPAFIEGSTRYSNQVSVVAPNGRVDSLSALGPQHWYANVPLLEQESTPISVRFEQGQLEETSAIRWVPWNAMTDEAPAVRVGDTLKLTLSDPSDSTAILVKRGRNRVVLPITEAEPIQHYTFDQPGKYQFQVRSSKKLLRKLQTEVHDPNLGTKDGYVADHASDVIFPNISPSLFLDSGPSVEIVSQRQFRRGIIARLRARENGPVPLAVRLHKDGPIVIAGDLSAINYSDVLRNETARFSGRGPEGYFRLTTSIVITGLPPGGYAELVINKAGVMFMDGTRRMIVKAEDLRDGVFDVEFVYPIGMEGGYCHYIVFYDANGNAIARR